MLQSEIDVVTSYSPATSYATFNRVKACVSVLSKHYTVNVYMLVARQDIDRVKKQTQSLPANIFFVASKSYSKSNFILRALSELYYAFKLYLKQRKSNSSYVFITIPFMFLALPWAIVNKRKRVLDIRDLSWEYLSHGSLLNKIIADQLKKIMLGTIRHYPMVTVTNPEEEIYVKALQIQQKVVLVSNGISQDKFDQLSTVVAKNNEQNCLVITYAGNLGMPQNLSVIIKAVSNMDNVILNIAGQGGELASLQALVDDLNAQNIIFQGSLSFEELKELYSRSDVLYAQLSGNYSYAVPSKIYEYLATGKAVLYGGEGAAAKVLQHFERVYTVEPDNVEALSQALKRIYRQDCRMISRPNRDRISQYYIRERAFQNLLDNL